MGIATQIMMSISGQDRTGEAFSSVASRASKASSHLRRAIGAATAGIGAALIVRSAKQSIDAMGEISDQAQRTGTSAVYIQQLTAALDQVGVVGVNMDSLAAAFGKMTKETGATGAKGFEDTLASIAAIGDEGPRVEKLSQIFGRQMGANLAPLVRQGPDALRAGLRDVMAAMPAVSDEAVGMGDGVSDALKRAGLSAQVAWRQALGDIMGWLQSTFGLAPAEAITIMTENIKWGVEVGAAYFHALGANIGKIAAYFVDDWKGALGWLWDGIKEVLGAVFNYFAQTFKLVGNLGIEFGKHLWSAMKGEGFNWSGFADEAGKEFAKVGAAGLNVFKALKIEGNDALKLETPDMGKMLEGRRTAIDTALKGLAAQSQLASGGVVEKSAAKAVKAVRDAAKNTLTEAGTYDAMKIAMQNRTGITGLGVPQQGRTVGGAVADQSQGLLASLVTVAKNIESRLSSLDTRISALEYV